MIPIDIIQKTAEILMDKAAIEIPQDYLDGLQAAAKVEDGDLSSFVLEAMLENYKAAKEDRRAMCGDTGTPRWYVKMGNETQIEGGPIALEAALRRATANATNGVPLRPNRVHPLWRTDHDNNVGIGAPEIEYGYEPGGEWIDLITVHKGGLFGTDYRMLFPSDGIQGIKRFLSRLPGGLRQARAGLPAGDHRHRAWRLQGYLHGAGQARRLPARRRIAEIPILGLPNWSSNSRNWAIPSAWARWGLSASRWSSMPISR